MRGCKNGVTVNLVCNSSEFTARAVLLGEREGFCWLVCKVWGFGGLGALWFRKLFFLLYVNIYQYLQNNRLYVSCYKFGFCLDKEITLFRKTEFLSALGNLFLLFPKCQITSQLDQFSIGVFTLNCWERFVSLQASTLPYCIQVTRESVFEWEICFSVVC